MLFFPQKLSILLSLIIAMLRKRWGVGSQGVIRRDLRDQIEKF